MKLKTYIYSLAFIGFAAGVATSCEDMLDKGNDYVIYADNLLINERAEMNTSLLGIMNKVQAVAVRNNLLGELRADLVTVNATAPDDLKEIASLDINNVNDNIYNNPADYYAIINNCNYFLAHVDSLASDIDGTKFFESEIAQVHSIRAWTYLQLVLAYGEVPFVTEPVLTASQADESKWPKARLSDVCDYFINDLKPYYGKLYSESFETNTGWNPDLVFFPTQLVMGDLYLWRAVKNQDPMDALNAAKSYYDFLVWDRNKQYVLTSNSRCAWKDEAISSGSLRTGATFILHTLSYSTMRSVTSYSSGWTAQTSDPITIIPMDSASSVGYYNDLRKIYNASLNDESAFEEAKVAPSEMLRDLSQSQTYVMYYNNTVTKLDKNMFSEEDIEDGLLGDLRFYCNYTKRGMKWNSKDVEYQSILKHQNQHITVYRTAQVYLRLAEALNYAGYPRMSRQILTMG
ncbi:MAG: RagB/SusD family nutrient uptake outer membrane protein, partial [Bacteroidaceae bacterium]|nr:RagB/SusD family nutrient uptake outer membrane protein [Bacteroidaceae bacterium]